MTAQLRVVDGGPSDETVMISVRQILAGRDLMSMATYSTDLGPHVNSAFFAADDDLIMWFVSERTTRHSLNIAAEPRVSASVFLDPPTYGEGLCGIQVWGTAREARQDERAHAVAVLRLRFPSFAADTKVLEGFLNASLPSTFYRLEVSELTVLDEPRFGRRVYVRAAVAR
ncbi:pyridoxamine 5'-phosphate oxidase family protein [Actinoplanes sp. NBRC 103695]|uniref:pyridoxamine 5'-phosphate oxidase family protein n=1 Tax=Actinoplanes sp. NBRC 103695 TaxID=3032202 RepID=UPI0024A35EB9|nr:pyridoxamine 5'-phosphate oxidase family protein [Actinoplanes sp. NBRC 103695]GLY95813.1 hypothetical protein Acsp02_30680 [Actinoplanes sp. NBRC 103695]